MTETTLRFRRWWQQPLLSLRLWWWRTTLYRWLLAESPFTRTGRAWRRWEAVSQERERLLKRWHAVPDGRVAQKEEAWAWLCVAKRRTS